MVDALQDGEVGCPFTGVPQISRAVVVGFCQAGGKEKSKHNSEAQMGTSTYVGYIYRHLQGTRKTLHGNHQHILGQP